MAIEESKEDGLELVKELLKRIVKGFYEPKHAIVLDIVLAHSAIRDDHLALLMGLQNQDVRKLCGVLREDRIIRLYTRSEPKEGQSRPVHRSYYFVDYRDAVDCIKFRIHRLVRTIEEKSKNDFDSKGYVCPRCQRRYGALDVLPLVSMDGQSFDCATCGFTLADDEESLESRASQERLSRLQQQTHKIVATLKAIDASHVPNNDHVAAMANAVPPNIDLAYTDEFPHGIPKPQTAQADTTTTASLGVAIDYNATQQDTPAELARKAAQAQTNRLPEWHKHSTVPGTQQYSLQSDVHLDEDVKDVKLDANAADEVAEYYRALKEQPKDSDTESDEEISIPVSKDSSSDDDEEEGEFEDV